MGSVASDDTSLTAMLVLLFAGAYLLGSIPFGLLIARARGVDIRGQGSGNVGATNVGRSLGKKWGALVLLLDAGKGAAACLTARWLGEGQWGGDPLRSDFAVMGAALCVVAGNVAPFYLRFRGGKGVATSLGVVLSIYPFLTWPAVIALAVFVGVAWVTRYVSLGSIVAVWSVPVSYVVLSRLAGWQMSEHYPLLLACLCLATLVTARHAGNIRRLAAGTENRMGRRGA